MSDFTAKHVDGRVIWDSNTDEVTLSVPGGPGKATFVTPDYCYAIQLSASQATSAELFLSPDNTDIDSGIAFNSTIQPFKRLGPIRTVPGVTFTIHNSHASNANVVNIVRYFNKPA